ncbi:MAG TPA: AraC family transcriptional regulator [Chitinophagaceae bacterium]|nr:AraC family transcriptional regulator [Chitinophagaceae bacterium]MCB9054855.1 AraC family transcriptional regulator [Chitinophagales bacterium]HPG10115.1 AraC family transcriptional regulator [Chitinophagaceae bacterium]
MRPKLELLSHKRKNQSFVCYELTQPSFDFFWHYHPEYELTYIISGKGRRLIGTNYELFSEGDLVLLGPDLPHTWIVEKNKKQLCKAIVIQFSKEFIEPFLQFGELKDVKKMIARSVKGIHFIPGKNSEVAAMIKQMPQFPESRRLIQLLFILQKLTETKAISLNAAEFKTVKGDYTEHRMNKIFQYVQNGYRQTISLKKAASLIHLSESAFCKYFKRFCGKTFSDYVNEIRIMHACQLLVETDIPVSRIAYDAGYESLTYFNRVFLKKKKISPNKFRQWG